MNNKEQAAGRGEFKRNSNAYASLPPTPSTSSSSASASTGPTVGKPRRQHQQQQQQEPERYGLSHSLSSESMRQACDYYDDELSDEDLIEIQQTPQGFHQQKQKSKQKQQLQLQPISFKMDINEDDRSAFCGSQEMQPPPLSTPIKRDQGETNEAELCVLNELDAILDVHGASQLNGTPSRNTSPSMNSGSDDDKVEDYLMDLDNYLEEMDNALSREDSLVIIDGHSSLKREPRTRTLPLSRKRKAHKKSVLDEDATSNGLMGDGDFHREHQIRKTFSCSLGPTTSQAAACSSAASLDASPDEPVADVWLRQSLRRAMEQQQHPEPDETKATVGEEDDLPTLLVDLPPRREADMRRCFSHGDCQTHHQEPQQYGSEMLTEAHIFDNLLQNEQRTAARASSEERPRQYGRRLEGPPTPSRGSTVVGQSRPQSAPTRVFLPETETPTHQMMTTCSELSSARSSRMPSPLSLVSDSSSSSVSTTHDHEDQDQDQVELQAQSTTMCSASSTTPLEPLHLPLREKCGFNSHWPHAASRTLALMACTLGVFNLCRFAVLTMNYGGNFLLQFLILSIIFGIPLFWLQMCLGAKIRAGPVSMWKISPICSGVGIALVMVQCFLAIYSTVSIAWILVYLRDVFPTADRIGYRWQELAFPYRYDTANATGNLTHTVAEYFNIVVLQRLHLAKHPDAGGVRFHVNDRLAFYLALIWAGVFLILCKGLKSLGKFAYLINTLPLLALTVVTVKFLYVVDPTKLQNIFAASDFDEFLVNSNSWTAATQETFLTWGLLGASVIAITSRTHASASKTTLRRDAIVLVLLTFLGLGLMALLALCCGQILWQHGYIYVPGSFENSDSYTSVYSLQSNTNPQLLSYPRSLVPHYSSFIGETYRRNRTLIHIESGFQALRFITELFPAVLSLASESISWVWAAVAFALFACFGLAQLCVMWKPISSALGNSTSSVLLSCVTGLLLSIPFATEVGISILYYVDFLLGGSWFIPIIWTAQIFGVFLIRGRPYNGDDLVNDLRMCGSMSAFLALSWNVLLPIGLITLSVIDYKASLSNQFYYWRGKSYFTYWLRKTGSLIQIGIVLVIPVTAIIQIYRYLTHGPPDILERIQLLYRPPEEGEEPRRPSARQTTSQGRRNASGQQQDNGQLDAQNDAPPKYTPPPSYTTATGARLAKLLRQSIRRSVRRVLGDSSRRTRPVLSIDAESGSPVAPPDYLTILTNPAGSSSNGEPELSPAGSSSSSSSSPESIEIGQRPSHASYAQRSQSLGRKLHRPGSETVSTSAMATLERRPYTAEDVVTILRSSVRHRQPPLPRQAGGTGSGIANTLPRPPTAAMSTHLEDTSFRSIENLVLNAEPPDRTPGVDVDECAQNNTSVI